MKVACSGVQNSPFLLGGWQDEANGHGARDYPFSRLRGRHGRPLTLRQTEASLERSLRKTRLFVFVALDHGVGRVVVDGLEVLRFHPVGTYPVVIV